MKNYLPPTFLPHHGSSEFGWITEGCKAPLFSLNRYVPRVFADYVRICHPGRQWPADADSAYFLALESHEQIGRMTPVTWSEVARINGVEFDGTQSWGQITTEVRQDYLNPKPLAVVAPTEGRATPGQIRFVFDELAVYSGKTQECYCAFWEGFGCLELPDTGTLRGMGQPPYRVMKSSLEHIRDYWLSVLEDNPAPTGLTPEAVWPTNDDWFYAVPFEMYTSLLGGSRDLIKRLIGVDAVESYRVDEGILLGN